MGAQASSAQPADTPPAGADPVGGQLRWQCSDVKGLDHSKHEIIVTERVGGDHRSHGKGLGLDNGSRRKDGPSSARPDSRDARSGKRRDSDNNTLYMSDLGNVRNFTGPQSEGSFISGLSARSSASGHQHRDGRASPPLSVRSGDLSEMDVTTAAMRAREQNEWDDTERDKEMFLRRIHAQYGKGDPSSPSNQRPPPGQDQRAVSRPRQRGSGSEGGNSDPARGPPSYERHNSGGKQRLDRQRVAERSEGSDRSGRSGFSLSGSFRSAMSGVSDRYRGIRRENRGAPYREGSRENSRDRYREDRGSHSSRGDSFRERDREDASASSNHTPREYDEYGDGRRSPRDHRAETPALRDRDRDDNSSGRSRRSGSQQSGAGRRSVSRSGGSVDAAARGPGKSLIPGSRRGPGMSNWIKGDDRGGGGGSSQGSQRGQLAMERYRDGGSDYDPDDAMASNDLEAKLKNAQRNLTEVSGELEAFKKEQELMKSKKKKDMPGGSAVQHALMQDLRELRDYCVDLRAGREQEEGQAKDAISKLRLEQDARKEDIRIRMEAEGMQADLQSRIDTLTHEAKEYDSKLNVTSKDTAEMKKLLAMIQSERDETLTLLRRAVNQKEKMKGDRQRDTQEAASRMERLQDQQKNSDGKVRELLNSVDTLLGKFSLDREDNRSPQGGARSTVAVQLELMKIRDSIRFLLKAAGEGETPRQTGGALAKRREV